MPDVLSGQAPSNYIDIEDRNYRMFAWKIQQLQISFLLTH